MPPVLEVGGALGGIAAFVLALYYVARAIRGDVSARLDAYVVRLEETNRRLEKRVTRLERHLSREERRRYQLEAIMRAAAMEVPAWTMDPADIDDLDDPLSTPHPIGAGP